MTANNATAELKIFVDHHKKDICFNDPHSDLFVMFKSNIIPLHKEIASNSAYLNELAKSTKNMIFINEDLNLNALLKVLSCLYGHVLKYDRSIHTTQIFDVVMFLNVDKLKQAMLEDIQNYFEDYGIFTLYNIASKYSVGWLQKKCLNQLIYLKFQQILINKFDLFKISKETFFMIFKRHQTLKQKGIQLTLSEIEVKKLVQQYNSVHSLSLSADDILSSTVQDDQSLDNIFDDFDIVGSRGTKIIKKRKSTWNCPNSTKLIQVDKLETTKKRRDTEDVKNGLEWSRQINDLKKKNRQILSRSNSMLQQIKATTAKAQCINFSNENRRQEKIHEKISEMVQVLKQQSIKLQKAQQTVRELLLKSK